MPGEKTRAKVAEADCRAGDKRCRAGDKRCRAEDKRCRAGDKHSSCKRMCNMLVPTVAIGALAAVESTARVISGGVADAAASVTPQWVGAQAPSLNSARLAASAYASRHPHGSIKKYTLTLRNLYTKNLKQVRCNMEFQYAPQIQLLPAHMK